jgi:hypothetical protein
MNPTKGYYSLIQYCPDLGRLEAANVGVLLFCPERHFLQARTSRGNRRINRFFGAEGHDWERINAFKKGLEERLESEGARIDTLEQLEDFIAGRANLLQITPPRPMKVTDPAKDLDALYDELIGVPERAASGAGPRSLRRKLAKKLSAPRVAAKVRHDIQVCVPILQKEVQIPYGYQNGRFNLITPVQFAAADTDRSVNTACKYAVEGRSLFECPDENLGPLQLVIVGQFRRRDHESPALVKRILEQHDVKLYRASELPELIHEIETTGKDVAAGL